MPDKRLKVGIVGLGMGSYHLENYARNPRAEVVAVCDLNQPYAEILAKRYGVPAAVSDYRELVDNREIDAVSIATPTWLHAQMAMEFLGAGKHVLVEKPMADSLGKAQEMAAAAAKAGKILTVHHNQRFCPTTMLLRQMVEDGALGTLYLLRTGWRRSMFTMKTATVATVEREGFTFDKSWFMDANKGGGVLLDLGSHMIDRAMYVLGFPKPIRMMGANYHELGKLQEAATGYKFDAEDLATGLIQFENGLSVQLEVSFGSYIQQDAIYMDVYGSNGGVSDRDDGFKTIDPFYGTAKITRLPDVPRPTVASPVDDFVESVLEGREPLVTVEQSLAVMGILDGLKKSAMEGPK